MRILIAPDKFKGSLTAQSVAENIATGIREVLPEVEIDLAPIADGGEGTAEVIHRARGGEWVRLAAHNAMGKTIEAHYLWLVESGTAVIAISEAAGIQALGSGHSDPLHGNTYGVGEMLRHAANHAAKDIIVALGGSVTNDGGSGMARALGFRFFAGATELTDGPIELARLTRISQPQHLILPPVVGAVDVRNPLLGERGATRVFGAQKGVKAEQIPMLERALTNLAERVAADLGREFRETPGAGAAGGLGFGLMSFCGAELRSGFKVVAGAIGLEEKVGRADIVVTGEGKLDSQTFEGKAPAGVAKLARQHHKSVYAIVGQKDPDADHTGLFDEVFALTRGPISGTEAIKRSAELLRERAQEMTQKAISSCR